MARLGGDREAPQLLVARIAQPREQRMAASGAQRLLGGPQRIAPARRAHHRQMREIDSRGSKRRRVRQVRRRQPYDALARRGQAGERWQQQSKLADALAATQDLGERARGPSAAGKLRIQIGEARRHGGRGPPRRRAAPNPGLLQEIFQGRHDTGILYSIRTIASENRGQSPISVNPTSRLAVLPLCPDSPG